jgi:hypothetical protein
MNFNGMWAEPGNDPREALEQGRGEKAVLSEYLDRYRMTFELKCEGLCAAQLATRSVPPSSMSLRGLIRHLASRPGRRIAPVVVPTVTVTVSERTWTVSLPTDAASRR